MADSRKQTRIVEYRLQGNTVDLEQRLKAAISTLDVLDQKLTKISASARMVGGKEVNSTSRASAISTAETQIQKLRATLSSGDIKAVSPDQLNLLNQYTIALERATIKLGSFKSESTVTNKVIQQTEKVVREANAALRASGMTAQTTQSAWSKLRGAFGKFLTLQYVIRLLYEAYEVSTAFVETINLFNVAVKSAETDLDAFVQKMSQAFGYDPGPIYESVAIFRQYANTMGMAASEADLLSENLTMLSTDLASLYNTDVSTMTNALKSGLAGLTKPLMRYGISVHKATLEQKALELGVQKSWEEFTEAEKVALRYIAIMDQTASAQGDLARTLESPANQLKILKQQLQVLIRNIGTIITMIAQIATPVVNGFLMALNSVLETLNAAAGYEIPDYSDNLSENNQLLGDETSELEDLGDAAEGADDALRGLLGFDELNLLGDTSAVSDSGEIDPTILAALEGYDNLMDLITSKTTRFAEIFKQIFGNEQFAKGVGTVLGEGFQIFAQVLDLVLDLLETLSPVVGGVLEVVGYLLEGIGYVLQIVSPVLEFLSALLTNIWTLIGAFAAFNLAQLAITGEFKSMIAVKILKFFGDLTKKVAEGTAALIKNAAAALKAKIATIAEGIAARWAAAAWWQKAIAVIAAAGALALVVVGTVMAATAATSATANSTMAQGSDTPPAMARGGVVSAPTLALIGEGRYNEAVVPLGNSPQFTDMKTSIADAVVARQSNGNSPVNLTVQVKLGEREFNDFVYKVVNDGNRQRTGISLSKLSEVATRR